MQRFLAISLLALTLALTGSAASAQSPPLQKVVIARAFESLLYVSFYYGNAKHIWEKHGLEVSTFISGSSANSVAAVISKDATFSVQDPMTVMLAQQKGAKIKSVAAVISGLPVWITVRKDSSIKTVADLAGKTIATASLPSTSTYLLQNLLKARGIKADFLYVPIGTEVAPIVAGKADAGSMYEPAADQCINQGCRVLYEFSHEAPAGFAFTSIAASDETIATKPEVVQKFVDSLDEIYKAVAADPEGATQITTAVFPNLPPDVVRLAVRRMMREGAYPRSPLLDESAFNAALQVQIAAGNVKPGQVKYTDSVDPQFGLKLKK